MCILLSLANEILNHSYAFRYAECRVPGMIASTIPSSILCIVIHHINCYLYSSGGLVLWQWCEAEVWSDNADVGEDLLGILCLNAGVDNNIVTRNPVDWGRNLVLVTVTSLAANSFTYSVGSSE